MVHLTFRADRGDAGQRLDRVLLRHLADRPDLSRSRVQAWIAEGRVRVGGTPALKPAARLAPGDLVEADLPPPPPARPAPRPQELPLAVLYEDEHLLALDKPPGLVVHPTYKHAEGTLLNALLHRARDWPPGRRPHLAQRLDKGTSGVLLVAKTGEVHGAFARAAARGLIQKEYLAVVYGRPPARKGSIDLKLARDAEDSRRVVASKSTGLASETRWEVVADAPDPAVPLALLACILVTGRTHQIRVHLAAAGWPIVGDPTYGEPRWKGLADPRLADLCRTFPRQALHARRLALAHPATNAPLDITAPLPADMAELLATVGIHGM